MTSKDSTPDWSAARAAMMLDPTVTNLNTGSYGPTPRPVFDRVTELRRQLAAEPMDFLLRRDAAALVDGPRTPRRVSRHVASAARVHANVTDGHQHRRQRACGSTRPAKS